MAREPFPLQWPEGWKRATQRYGRGTSSYQAKFEPNFTKDRDSIIRQLKKRGSRIVITSNLPTRGDGLPYAAPCSDPGIAVYWVEKGVERVIACDRWTSAALNLRAIEMSLEAMRGLDRWGASEMVERAFAGFAALPPGSGAEYVPPPRKPTVRPWREVFSVPGVFADHMKPAELLAFVKLRHREQIKAAHPDAGGSHDAAAEINAALAAAEQELSK